MSSEVRWGSFWVGGQALGWSPESHGVFPWRCSRTAFPVEPLVARCCIQSDALAAVGLGVMVGMVVGL